MLHFSVSPYCSFERIQSFERQTLTLRPCNRSLTIDLKECNPELRIVLFRLHFSLKSSVFFQSNINYITFPYHILLKVMIKGFSVVINVEEKRKKAEKEENERKEQERKDNEERLLREAEVFYFKNNVLPL